MSEIKNLSPEEVMTAMQQGVEIIDIRTPQEWQQTGTIKGARRIMFFNGMGAPLVQEFMAGLQDVITDKDQKLILVCRSGARTAAAANFLHDQMGYTQVMHLAHGMNQWLAENREVER